MWEEESVPSGDSRGADLKLPVTRGTARCPATPRNSANTRLVQLLKNYAFSAAWQQSASDRVAMSRGMGGVGFLT